MDVLSKDLKVIDAAAVSLARENNIPIIISSILKMKFLKFVKVTRIFLQL